MVVFNLTIVRIQQLVLMEVSLHL